MFTLLNDSNSGINMFCQHIRETNMNDAGYCNVGCPANSICPVADPNLGCVIGTTRPHNPGTPRCCQVDANFMFMKTVRDILAHGNDLVISQQNVGTVGIRQALGALLQTIDIPGGPSFFDDNHRALIIDPDLVDIHDLTESHIDDLVQILQKMVPQSGFQAELPFADIQRQPRVWRENLMNTFVSMPTPTLTLPPKALNIAANLDITATQANGPKLVSLFLNALADPDPMPSANTRIRVAAQLASKINRRNIAQIGAAMQATRFVGTLSLISSRYLLKPEVDIGQFQVSPGKSIRLTLHLLEVTIA